MVSERKQFVLAHQEARRRAMSAVAEAPPGYVVTVQEPNRSLDQNAAQWQRMTDCVLATQERRCSNGYECAQRLEADSVVHHQNRKLRRITNL